MTAESTLAEWSVRLTASPLQRVGAFALACMGGADHPEELTSRMFLGAVESMTQDLVATRVVANAGDPGGFWLSASYMLWPNSSLNPTNRRKQSEEERMLAIRAWRAAPEPEELLDAPCTYCGRAACGWFGKVDIPLGASVAHRNTTAPGHEGTPLCYPCLASLWAFPYGAVLSGGRATVVHSWDDRFLKAVTFRAVDRTQRAAKAAMPKGVKPSPYQREHAVLKAVRAYEHRVRAPVELMALSNSNKEQVLIVQEMEQPVAEWLRSTRNTALDAGYRALVETQGTPQVPGEAFLAKRAFSDPGAVVDFAVGHLLGRMSPQRLLPPVDPALGTVLYSYCQEVLFMEDKDVERVKKLAGRVADLVGRDDRPGPFNEFIRANNKGGDLHGWFRSKSVDWLLRERKKEDPPLLPVYEYRLLFEDERTWRWRRLLVFAVIEELIRREWRPRGSQEEMDEMKDTVEAADNTDGTD
ncbi:hypothetical protein [Streptomyces sp. PT12]|uniref:hypothetical protein n=1 Tax=Streptomyces sp. PT12 TaxID=1510197 RepID=UPI000DE2834A|nr:hypothetical protein [Streptomyces sp. PT12]RBM10025.1 hypothetical protein DEH69_22890 [Streptomyces sp. PT12]